jgi:large subunit ribosomal protein L4
MSKTATAQTTTVDVVDVDGEKVGSVDLPADWFSGEINVGVMHQVVTAQLANARQGTAKTKTRGEARGGGRKPWRQKGTGRARHGSIRSPIWVGGGVAHGRRAEENHSKRVNKRMKRTALRSALTDRAQSGDVTVVRALAFESPRTKNAVATLEALGHADRKVLLVLGNLHEPTWRSFRNLPAVHMLTVDQLNTYDVLCSDVVVFGEEALELIGTGKRSGPPETTSVPAGVPEPVEEPEDEDEDVDEDGHLPGARTDWEDELGETAATTTDEVDEADTEEADEDEEPSTAAAVEADDEVDEDVDEEEDR